MGVISAGDLKKMEVNWANRTIWTGDNLSVMRGMNSESVDLIYLDPPFNSNRDYAAPIFFGEEERGAFALALSGFGVVPVHPPLPLRGADPAPLGVPSRLSRLVARG